mmetsp:Transcript_31670/g.30964  ORF Transcript_31670/g.30964 Transcript_31670/m.30964 type:complete len:156 (+) Transcript_31670:201-668(+)
MKPTSFDCTYANWATELSTQMLNQVSRGQVAQIEEKQCSLQEVCSPPTTNFPSSGPQMTDWKVRSEGAAPMRNLITDFNLLCSSKFEVGLIGSMYFFGESFGSFIYTFFIVKRQQTRINHIITKGFGLTLSMASLLFLVSHKMLLFVCMFVIGLC